MTTSIIRSQTSSNERATRKWRRHQPPDRSRECVTIVEMRRHPRRAKLQLGRPAIPLDRDSSQATLLERDGHTSII